MKEFSLQKEEIFSLYDTMKRISLKQRDSIDKVGKESQKF